jgi:hypothetical protein
MKRPEPWLDERAAALPSSRAKHAFPVSVVHPLGGWGSGDHRSSAAMGAYGAVTRCVVKKFIAPPGPKDLGHPALGQVLAGECRAGSRRGCGANPGVAGYAAGVRRRRQRHK